MYADDFRKTLDAIAKIGFQTGYKSAISILEKAAEKCPENTQPFLVSIEVLRQAQETCTEEYSKNLTKYKA